MSDRCAIPGCRRIGYVRYLRRWLCDRHWDRYADRPEQLRKRLRLPTGKRDDIRLNSDPLQA